MIKLIFILLAIVGTPLTFDPHLISTFDIPKAMILCISAMGLAFIGWEDYHSFKDNPLNLPVAAYFFSFMTSTVLSISPITSLMGEYKRYEGLISVACYLILFYSIASISSQRRLNIIILSMVWGAIPIASYGILQHFGYDFASWSREDPHRVFSTFGNPVFFAAYLAMIIPITIALFFKGSWLFLPIILLLLTALSFTASRASSIALLVGMVFFWGVTCKFAPKKKAIALLIAVVILVIATGGKTMKRLSIKNDERIAIWKAGIEIVKAYPFFGTGPDCILPVYAHYFEKANKIKPAQAQNRIHNDILDTLATRGIFGLGTYIWLLVAVGRLVEKQFKIINPERRLIVAGLACGLLVFIVQNQFEFASTPVNVQFWGMMGLCAALSKSVL